MQEIWKDVVGYEDYFMVSNLGNIFSKRTKKNLKQVTMKVGYKIFATKIGGRDGDALCFRVHRLVAEAFLAPPSPELVERCSREHFGKVIVRHKDNNKANNRADNLEWGTCADNTADWMATDSFKEFVESQVGSLSATAKLCDDDVRFIRDNYIARHPEFGARALAAKFGVSHKRISYVVRGLSFKNVI